MKELINRLFLANAMLLQVDLKLAEPRHASLDPSSGSAAPLLCGVGSKLHSSSSGLSIVVDPSFVYTAPLLR